MAVYSEDSAVIRDRILDNMPDNVDKTEGYIVYDGAAALGKELSSNRSFLDEILAYAFPQTSSGKYLDYNAESRGLTRNLGVKATGQVTLTGVNATLIPKGFVVQTNGGLQYTLDSDAIITNGTITTNITAVDIGNDYNVTIGAINQIPVALTGLISVSNASVTTGGTDDETDSELIARLLQKVRNPPSCGNKSDYERWAKEVSGVEYVRCIPLWAGNGTVKVIVSGENGSPLDSTILTNVKNHIDPGSGTGEGEAPIGADITIITTTLSPVNVSITGLQVDNGYSLDTVKSNIQTSLTNFLAKLMSGSTINYNELRATFTLTDGVYDFLDFKINSGTSNIEFNENQKASLGTISYI